MKLRRIILIIFTIICVIFIAFEHYFQQDSLIVPSIDEDYVSIIENNRNEILVTQSNTATLENFSEGADIIVYDIQAIPLLKTNEDYFFQPHLIETVVLVIDETQVDVSISSFKEAMDSNYGINFDLGNQVEKQMWEFPKTHQVFTSLAFGLYQDYDVTNIVVDIHSLQEQGRFYYNDDSQPISITLDSVAVKRVRNNEPVEIVVPSDGTLSFVKGIFTMNNDEINENELLLDLQNAGYRTVLDDVQVQGYPKFESYQNASFVEDFDYFNEVASSISKVIQRDAFETERLGMNDPKERVGFYLGLVFIVILYLFACRQRASKTLFSSSLIYIIIMQMFFITVVAFKSIVNQNEFLEALLMYFYYIPIIMIPALLVHIAIYSGHTKKSQKLEKRYRIYLCACMLPLILVMTNDLHEGVFLINDYLTNDFDYNWGYYFVMLWILVSFIYAVSLLIYKGFRSPKKLAFLLPIITLLVGVIYTTLYVSEAFLISEFPMGFAVTFLVVLFIEACLKSQLIQNNHGYNRLFENSSIGMQIVDKNNHVFAQTSNFQDQGEGFKLCKHEISGGLFYYFEDHRSLNALLQRLKNSNNELFENNQLMLRHSKIVSDLTGLEAERVAYSHIDNILYQGIDKIEQLLEDLRDSKNPKSVATQINVIACSIKRECMLLINSLYKENQDIQSALHYLIEISEIIIPVNCKVTFGCTIDSPLSVNRFLGFYRVYCTAIESILNRKTQDLLVQIYERKGNILFSISSYTALFNDEEVKQKEIICDDLGLSFEQKKWEESYVVILSYSKEGIHA